MVEVILLMLLHLEGPGNRHIRHLEMTTEFYAVFHS
jgi:hypothetical protein